MKLFTCSVCVKLRERDESEKLKLIKQMKTSEPLRNWMKNRKKKWRKVFVLTGMENESLFNQSALETNTALSRKFDSLFTGTFC